MRDATYKLDMSMMLAVHGALRRELEQIARVAARPGDDPRRILSTALGWERFKTYLRVHHTAEDDTVWPVMEQALAGKPDDLALLEAMEAEHAAIDPLLLAVDAALVDRERGPGLLGGLVGSLITVLGSHLKHEEAEGLPLIDATMTPAQWSAFGVDHRTRIGKSAPEYLPWVLDGASDEIIASILGHIPPQFAAAYESEWKVAYRNTDLWAERPGATSA